MAVRIQLRRDTAANWSSTNPLLYPGEFGIETDTLKIKMGPLVTAPTVGTAWNSITQYVNLVPDGNSTIGDYVLVSDINSADGVAGLDSSGNLLVPGSNIKIEGATDNTYETTLQVTDPTADRTITFKNADGTVAFTSDIPSSTDSLSEGSTNKYFTDERAQDAVATALAAGTHTNISVSYNDAGNAISLTGAQTYNDENAQDAIGNNLGTGLSYNDTTGAISVDTSTIQARVANVTDTEIGYLDGVTSAIQTQIDTKLASSTASSTYSPIASPTFTGIPAAPTPTAGTNTTQLATTAFVKKAVDDLIDAAPGTLDTLNELAAAINDDASYAATMSTALGNKQDKVTGVSDTEIGYLDGVTSAIQTQLNAKAASADITELAQDAVGNNVGTGLSYNDTTGAISVTANTYDAYGSSSTVAGNLSTHESDTTTHGTTGNIVGASDTQTLTNKTLTSPKINEDVALTATATELNYVDGVTSAIQTQLDNKLALAGGTLTGALTLHADPGSALHAATKQYVDNTASGIVAKPQVLGATTLNIDATYNNGTAGVGATLTRNTNGVFPATAGGAEGWAVGKGILVKNQTNKAQNGRYYISDMGSSSTPYVLTRCGYCDEASEIPGAYIFVQDGTSAGTGWVQTVADATTFTVGTDDITIVQFSGSGTITAGTGITVSGNEVSINTAATVDLSTAQTLTNKTINANANTITVTSANVSDFNEAAQDAIGTILGTGLAYNDAGPGIGIDNAALTTYLLDGASGNSYGLIGTSVYLDVKNTNGYNKEIELDIAAVKTQLNTDGYLTTSSTSTLTNKTFTSPKINEDVAVTATATELNYVDGVTSSIQTQLDAKLASSTASSTYAPLAAPALTGDATAVNLTISGNLTVNGTTTNINSTNLVIEDKNIVLGDVTTPSNITANGGGITLNGDTNKTFNWINATTAWTSSENIDLASGKVLKIAGTEVLSATAYTGKAATAGTADVATDGVVTTGTYSNPSWITGLGWSKISSTPTTLSGYGITDALSSSTAASTYLTQSNASSTYQPIVSGVSDTEIGYLDGVTSGIQTQLDSKIAKSLVDAKGDILVGSADNTVARLAIGTDGYLLTADAASTNGVKWAAAPVSLPSQTGSSGKYLTTDGTSASWGTLVVPITTGTATVSANTATTVDTTALSAFTSIEYMVSLKQGSKIRTSKVLVQTDGTSVDMTEFAITETGGTIAGVVISATTSSTNSVLQLTATDATSTNVTVKFSKVSL